MISENLTEFFGLPVLDFKEGGSLAAPASTAYRIRIDWDEHEKKLTFSNRFQALLETHGSEDIQALVVGTWDGAAEGGSVKPVVDALVGAASKLPNLKALFIGDIISEECEISWIENGDVSPLWAAYSALEEFGVRGANGLSLASTHTLDLPHLRKLSIQAGGLPKQVVGEVINGQLPALESLEIWLGTDEYGGDSSIEDIQRVLNSSQWPQLTYLGLRNSEIANEIAEAVGSASIIPQLETLDLSMGTLTDRGAEALVAAGNLGSLLKLDIHYHFCSDAGIEKLRQIGCALDASDPQEPYMHQGEPDYYVAVSE